MSRKKDKRALQELATDIARGRELHWDELGREAVGRAGRGPQLKGVIHELARRDFGNLSPASILRGEVTKLTRSQNARVVDLVTQQSSTGKVLSRYQLKDVVSDSGMRDLVERVDSGQYRSAQLVGTKETAEKYGGTGSCKVMRSSGVSSTATTRAADNAGARVPNKNLLQNNLEDTAKFAGGAAVVGGVLGGVAEACHSYDELKEGRIGGLEYTGRVVTGAAKSGGGAAAKTAAALALKEGGKEIAKRAGVESMKRVAGSNVATAVAFGVVEQVVDTGRFVTGDIDGSEYGKRSLQNAGGTGGALGGAAGGAAIGTAICPGVGTAIGALIGGISGGISGGCAGRGLGRLFWGD